MNIQQEVEQKNTFYFTLSCFDLVLNDFIKLHFYNVKTNDDASGFDFQTRSNYAVKLFIYVPNKDFWCILTYCSQNDKNNTLSVVISAHKHPTGCK